MTTARSKCQFVVDRTFLKPSEVLRPLATVFLVKGLVCWEKAFLNFQNICVSNNTTMGVLFFFFLSFFESLLEEKEKCDFQGVIIL